MATESHRRTESSVTLYDSLTAFGLDNLQPFPSIGSRNNSAASTDGSLGLYFSPIAPAGKESYGRRTVPGQGFFVILRLYGPTQAFFNKSWKPDDVVQVK